MAGPAASRRGRTGLVLRALAWGALFFWAMRGPTGAAVLEGAVLAEVLTWIVFRFLRWQFLGLRLDAETAVEFAVVVLFLNRGWLLSIDDSAEAFAVTALAFLFVVLLKTVVWGIEHALTLAGAREPASP